MRHNWRAQQMPMSPKGGETKQSEEGVSRDDEESSGGPMRKYGHGMQGGTQQSTHGP
jgi:hypothetical protein